MWNVVVEIKCIVDHQKRQKQNSDIHFSTTKKNEIHTAFEKAMCTIHRPQRKNPFQDKPDLADTSKSNA